MALVDGDFCPSLEYQCDRFVDEASPSCSEYARKPECRFNQESERFCVDRYEWPNKLGEKPAVFVTVRSLEGEPIEDVANAIARAWGVGQKGKDNGAVLFLFTEDRTLRLATGYGLEGAIPDVHARRILRELVKPHLQRGDVAVGIDAGVDAILRLARGEGFEGSGSTVAEQEARAGIWWLLLAEGAIVAAILAFVLLRGRPLPIGHDRNLAAAPWRIDNKSRNRKAGRMPTQRFDN